MPLSIPGINSSSYSFTSYVSPRRRAQHTLELLNLGVKEPVPGQKGPPEYTEDDRETDAKVQVTEDIREWEYGDYEGTTSKQIAEDREKQGLHKWDIWRDGCPGGE